MDNIPLSRSTLIRKKFKYVEHEGDFEWISNTNHLKGRRLIVHSNCWNRLPQGLILF